MPEILFKKQCGAFVPLPEYYEAYNNLKEGLVYKAKVTRPRNYKYHKMFFASMDQEAFEELSKKSVMVGLKILSKQINMTEAKRIDYENTLVKFFLD